jgi:hypothetical protein
MKYKRFSEYVEAKIEKGKLYVRSSVSGTPKQAGYRGRVQTIPFTGYAIGNIDIMNCICFGKIIRKGALIK